MSVKKIVISPDNKKAVAFFEEIARKKAEIYKKIDNLTINKLASKKDA